MNPRGANPPTPDMPQPAWLLPLPPHHSGPQAIPGGSPFRSSSPCPLPWPRSALVSLWMPTPGLPAASSPATATGPSVCHPPVQSHLVAAHAALGESHTPQGSTKARLLPRGVPCLFLSPACAPSLASPQLICCLLPAPLCYPAGCCPLPLALLWPCLLQEAFPRDPSSGGLEDLWEATPPSLGSLQG